MDGQLTTEQKKLMPGLEKQASSKWKPLSEVISLNI